MYCKKCGTYNQDQNNFCVSCNEYLKSGVNKETFSENSGNGEGPANKAVSIEKNPSNPNSSQASQQFTNQNSNGYQNTNGSQNTSGYQTFNGYQNQNTYQNQNGYQNQNTYQNGYQNSGYQNSNTYYNQNQGPYAVKNVNDIPEEYRPISSWGYLGYMLLFGIPIAGFVMLLIYSFGGTQNINLRNFARSYLILMIIAVILVTIIFIAAGAMVSNIFSNELIRELSR